MLFFSYFSELKTNLTKSVTAVIGVLSSSGVQVAVCGMRCIGLSNNALKILDTRFPYSQKLKEEESFYKTVTDIQRVLTITFHNFLVKLPPLKNGMNLRGYTIYMKVVTFNEYNK